MWPLEASVALDDPDARAGEGVAHVLGLLACEAQQPLVDGGEIDGDLRFGRAAVVRAGEELHPEVGRVDDRVGRLGGRDERLRWDDIREHRRAADPRALDERDLGTELRAGECRLVPAGAAADDRDAMSALLLVCHCSILLQFGIRAFIIQEVM